MRSISLFCGVAALYLSDLEDDITASFLVNSNDEPIPDWLSPIARKHIQRLHGFCDTGRECPGCLLQQSDLILVMEPEHLRFIATMAPENRGKSLLFGQWLETQDIPDLRATCPSSERP